MPATPTRYVLIPTRGFTAAADNLPEVKVFDDLHSSYIRNEVHTFASTFGPPIPVTVLDSIGPNKAKLVECQAEDLPALRASQPLMRILPLTFYYAAIAPRAQVSEAAAAAAAVAAGIGLTIQIASAADGTPVSGVEVVAFTNFSARSGAQGKTDGNGQVSLNLGGGPVAIERLYLYPPSGFWPGLQRNVVLTDGGVFQLAAIDLAFVDCVRFFYGADDLTLGAGVTVGVVDSGVSLTQPDLVVVGGQNTVQGEDPADFGDNGTEGHGTHVAGIIAARGTPPAGIRGVAPGVALRSYRVFGQGKLGASNFDIAKAIDAGIKDGCDLLNMSLGGGNADPLLEDALTSAHNAGLLVFVANGNDSRQPVSFPASNTFSQAISALGRTGTFPADSEPSGSVAAPFGTDPANFIADFSNIGPETDLTGPGVGVISTVPAGYGVMSGTSMATPAETGAAARVMAANPAILAMPRDVNRTAAMLAAIGNAAHSLGFAADFEGKGIIG